MADLLDALDEWRAVGLLFRCPGDGVLDQRDLLEHVVGQEVDQRDQEMAASHRRVADLEGEEAARRVETAELVDALLLGPAVTCQRSGRFAESGVRLVDQRADGLRENAPHQVFRRVVAARCLAGVGERPQLYLSFGEHRLELEQALVDRAEVLDREVAEIDPAAAAGAVIAAGESVEEGRKVGVGEARPLEERVAAGLEEAAVVGRQADRRVAFADGGEQVAEVLLVGGGAGAQDVADVDPALDLLA